MGCIQSAARGSMGSLIHREAPRTLRFEGQMVLPTGVSPRIGQASRQRFSGCGERRCAYKLRLSAAMYAQMYAQSWGHSSGGLAWPSSSHPQHSMVPPLVTPQLCASPALTLWNEPLGGVDRPLWSLPQHSMLPLAVTRVRRTEITLSGTRQHRSKMGRVPRPHSQVRRTCLCRQRGRPSS